MDNNRDLYAELHVFATIVECGSFTTAARLLKTTPAATSRAIQKLETALGVRLLNRTTRKVGTTDEGIALYEGCRPGLQQIQSVLSAARESRTQPKGLLRVTSSITFGRRFIAPLAIQFRKKYREIDIDLSLNDRIIDLIEQGIDIAIRGGRPKDTRLISRMLAPIPLYICASPRFFARHGIPSTPSDLVRFRCIRFQFRSSREPMRWEFASQGKQFALDVEGPLSIDDIDSACDAALADEGLVQLPGYVAVEHIRTGKLRPVLLDYLDASRAFSLTYVNRRDWQPLRDALFVDFIGESLQDPKLFALTDEELRTFRSSP